MSDPVVGGRFRVGGKYENRKGPFEIILMDRNIMRIRWDSGEEADCEIAMQERVMRNMEREMAEAARSPKRADKTPDWFGSMFRGLLESDFTGGVAGTSWRSREQLGGAVSRLLQASPMLTSWGVSRRPEIHWALAERYDIDCPWIITKFFVKADESGFQYGLYFERSHNPQDRRDEWQKWLRWMENSTNANWFYAALQKTGSELFNPYSHLSDAGGFDHRILPVKGGYRFADSSGEDIPITGLPQYFSTLPNNLNLSVVAGRKFETSAAIALGPGLAQELANHFNALLPAYLGTDCGGA